MSENLWIAHRLTGRIARDCADGWINDIHIERFDQPQRLFAIQDELVAVYSAVPHRELHQAAGYTALIHPLVGMLGQLHGQPLFFPLTVFQQGTVAKRDTRQYIFTGLGHLVFYISFARCQYFLANMR